MVKIVVLFSMLVFGVYGSAQDSTSVRLLFMGDVMGHDTQINSARDEATGEYDYKSCFKYIEGDMKSADVAIANLEVTLAGPPHKGYPQFSSPDILADALQEAGVDVLVTANNHCVDRRQKGLERTCQVLDKKGIPRTGTFINDADRAQNNPIKMEVNGIRLALLNYTYGTNGIRVTEPNIVNHLDTAVMTQDIRKAKAFHPDQIIVFLHWGNEYQTAPNEDQKKLAQYLWNQGVNIVIGSHPHVIQPMHWLKDSTQNKLVVYSLGNYISNQRTAPRDGGAMASVELTKVGEECFISAANYQLTWVHTPYENGKKKFYVLPVSRYEEAAAWPDSKARKRMNVYAKEASTVFRNNTNVTEKR
ncbi:MAG: CapA family protein [Marinilabiliaceae bacterium]|nr:CapA family protein [Marinilabiliaceae bacterium]